MSNFDMKIHDHQIHFSQDATYEDFIGQFQSNCSKILCIINGTHLRFYERNSIFPSNLHFDHKIKKNKFTEYHFRDSGNNTRYCIFGKDSVKVFCPSWEDSDDRQKGSDVQKDTKRPSILQPVKSNKDKFPSIVIMDGDKKIPFPDYNYPLEIRIHKS